MAGGRRGGGQSGGAERRDAVASLRLSFSFRAAALARTPLLWNCVAWMEGWTDRQASEEGHATPPLLLTLSSSAFWSWMELNANDLTELKSSKKQKQTKKNLFLFFCWSVLIVLSLLCLLMPFYVLYFSAYYSFGITYSLTYYKSSLFFS